MHGTSVKGHILVSAALYAGARYCPNRKSTAPKHATDGAAVLRIRWEGIIVEGC